MSNRTWDDFYVIQDCPLAVSIWESLRITWPMTRNHGHHNRLHHTSLEVILFIRSYLRDLSTLDGRDCTSCSGVLVRDCHGQVLGAYTQLHRHVFSAFAAKALAFVWFVKFACDLGLQRVVLYGDWLHVIQKLYSNTKDVGTPAPLRRSDKTSSGPNHGSMCEERIGMK
ncbi:hypothetical protein Gohar_008658 [Gossypium harknessii]|uniref:RNase H type-1 domain-containing protein n=1 Tax=Gossypium harknessii TaxID=34285 RepID=A0A7J9GKJ1_9ROSI|nr:hypothetical protein [Gossypium harknessii]